MSVQAASSVTPASQPVIINIDAKRDTQKNTFTSVWQGLQNLGYSEAEIAKIAKEMEKETVNGKKYNATKIANGTAVNVTDAIARAGVKSPQFGSLTAKTLDYDVRTHAEVPKDTSEVPAENTPEETTETAATNVQTFRGNPINVEPKTVDIDTIKAKYGDSKVLQTADGMKDLNETNGGDKIISGKSYYQPWCADLANYYYEQYNSTNPFASVGKRNSSVAGIKRWAKNNKVFNQAKTPAEINQQLQNLKPGDVVIFDRKYLYKTTKGDIYRNEDVRHIGIVVGSKDGKIVLMEGNTNERQLDENGNFIVNANGEVLPKSKTDGILFKEYDSNALYCRGYSGYADMANYQ